MSTRAAVIDVADDVERVDDQPLDEVAESDDKLVSTMRLDDGVDDDVEVLVLVRFV